MSIFGEACIVWGRRTCPSSQNRGVSCSSSSQELRLALEAQERGPALWVCSVLLGVVFASVRFCPRVRCSCSELDAVCLVCSGVRPQWGLAGERLCAEEEASSLPVSHGHLDGEETTALFLGFADSHSSSSLLPGNSLLSWQHQC